MSNTVRACLWMIGAIASFTSMAVAGREVSFELDTFEIILFRSLIGFAIVVGILTVTDRLKDVQFRKLDLHVFRNIAHFTGQNLWFYAITVIPLAQVFALEFTSPLWVIVLSTVILGEKLTQHRIIAGVVGFVGILIVARPSPDTINFGIITAALAAIGFALTIVFTRKLTRTESISSILFFLTGVQAILGLAFAGFDGDIALPSGESWPWVVLIAAAGLLAHYCLTNALKLAPATVVIPIDFTRLPIIAIVGMLLYKEPLDPMVLLGATIIFGANYYNIWRETRL